MPGQPNEDDAEELTEEQKQKLRDQDSPARKERLRRLFDQQGHEVEKKGR